MDVIRVTPRILSWQSAKFKIDGQRYTGFRGMSYDEKRERSLVHASREDGVPLGITTGKYTCDGVKITLLVDTAMALKEYLAGKAAALGSLGSYGDVSFILNYQLFEIQHTKPINVDFFDCYVVGNSSAPTEGPDGITCDLPLIVRYAQENGLSLYGREAL